MEFVDGTDAGHQLAAAQPGGMPVEHVIAITTAVAAALDHAHQRGLLHRDVKPANIMLANHDGDENEDRRILLADFGIARLTNEVNGLTTTNMTIGTVAYAAPEQLMGEDIDGRADEYGLAATAYHLFTGRQLFPHSNPVAVISHHLNSEPPSLKARRPELAALDPVLARALSKAPTARYVRCADFARALRRAVSTDARAAAAPTASAPIAPKSDSQMHPTNTAPSQTTRSKRWLTIGTAATVALALTVIFALWRPWYSPTADGPSASPPASTTAAASIDITTASSSAVAVPPAPVPTPPPITPVPPSVPAPNCGVDLNARVVETAIGSLELQEKGPLSIARGNFDPCATLSVVQVYPEGASGGAVIHALMFHLGDYVGTATPNGYSYMGLNVGETTTDTVVLTFRAAAGTCNACNDATYVDVPFVWEANRVVALRPIPDRYAG